MAEELIMWMQMGWIIGLKISQSQISMTKRNIMILTISRSRKKMNRKETMKVKINESISDNELILFNIQFSLHFSILIQY